MNYFTILEVILAFFGIFIAKWLQDVLTRFDDDHELFTADNPALGIAKAGYYLGLFIAFRGLFMGEGLSGWPGIRDFSLYILLTLILLNISVITTDRFILNRFKIYDLICKDRNEGVAWALVGTYIASASILAGAMSGDDVPLLLSCAEITGYFIASQLLLIVAALFFRLFNKSIHDDLAKGNSAAGISFCGFLAAIGIILGSHASGNMTLAPQDLCSFGGYSLGSIVFLVICRKLLFNYLFASGHNLQKEVFDDQNRAAGWIYASGSIGLALMVTEVL